jgi:hypothetical protein
VNWLIAMIVLTTWAKAALGNSACTMTLGRLVVLPTPRPNIAQAT